LTSFVKLRKNCGTSFFPGAHVDILFLVITVDMLKNYAEIVLLCDSFAAANLTIFFVHIKI